MHCELAMTIHRPLVDELGARLEWHLQNWAKHTWRGGYVPLMYDVSQGYSYSKTFEEIVEGDEATFAWAVNAIIWGKPPLQLMPGEPPPIILTPGERMALNNEYMEAVFHFNHGNRLQLLASAKGKVQAGLHRKGIP